MNAPTQNGRAVTEVATPPVVTSEGGIPTSDTTKVTDRPTWAQVEVGVKRFLNDFRTFQCMDVELEIALPVLCTECGLYPAAWMLRCFTCNAKMRLPTC